jgi:hypothetical protein
MGRRIAVICVVVACTAALGAGAASASPPWAIRTSPNPASATYSQLSGASCSSANACTAVGYYIVSGFVEMTLAEHWNGSSWTIQSTPNPAGAINSYLNGVSCHTATSCTAVGVTETAARVEETLAEHWNGTSWTIQSTPNPAGAAVGQLSAVSCPSAKSCIAAGNYIHGADIEDTLAEHWNGTSWTIQSTPNPSGSPTSALFGLSCATTKACSAVGDSINGLDVEVNLAESWNGTTWTIRPTPDPTGNQASSFSAVSCAEASACVAVGSYVNSADIQVTTGATWNGSTWTLKTTQQLAGTAMSGLQGVSCPSAHACIAVGYSGSATATKTLAESWNGTSWVTQSTPNPSGSSFSPLNAVACPSISTCQAAGYYVPTSVSGETLIEYN